MTKTTRRGKRPGEKLKTLAKVRTTLGDLIAAAFDTAGNKLRVVELLTSRELSRAAHARFVLQ